MLYTASQSCSAALTAAALPTSHTIVVGFTWNKDEKNQNKKGARQQGRPPSQGLFFHTGVCFNFIFHISYVRNRNSTSPIVWYILVSTQLWLIVFLQVFGDSECCILNSEFHKLSESNSPWGEYTGREQLPTFRRSRKFSSSAKADSTVECLSSTWRRSSCIAGSVPSLPTSKALCQWPQSTPGLTIHSVVS